jgi:uncharacterized damage-inducible protein DinB
MTEPNVDESLPVPFGAFMIGAPIARSAQCTPITPGLMRTESLPGNHRRAPRPVPLGSYWRALSRGFGQYVRMVWTAPDIKSADEPFIADERTMLVAFLDAHRDYLLEKCAGLTGEQLARQPVSPSNLSLLGLIRHMSEVERAWFRRRILGSDLPMLYVREDNEDADFTDVDPEQAEADYATLLRERDLAREAVADALLDDTLVHANWQREMSVRWVFHHMICEYAQHNGHADLIREAIDGVKS